MFFIFKIFPDWIWWLLLLAGILGFLASYLPQAKPFAIILKIVGLITVATSIFIFGLLYADNSWKAAAQELQAQVDIAQAKSQETNETIKEKIVTKVQVVRVRGAETIQYVDREVTKYDNTCVIPQEFVNAHNSAAKDPR
jgi:uncharacterized membrane protein